MSLFGLVYPYNLLLTADKVVFCPYYFSRDQKKRIGNPANQRGRLVLPKRKLPFSLYKMVRGEFHFSKKRMEWTEEQHPSICCYRGDIVLKNELFDSMNIYHLQLIRE
jgi:hypothetical protein